MLQSGPNPESDCGPAASGSDCNLMLLSGLQPAGIAANLSSAVPPEVQAARAASPEQAPKPRPKEELSSVVDSTVRLGG
jgi:hypothetical protein